MSVANPTMAVFQTLSGHVTRVLADITIRCHYGVRSSVQPMITDSLNFYKIETTHQ